MQYTDELTPLMEWLEENVSKSTREINSSSAAETEEHQERQEKVIFIKLTKLQIFTKMLRLCLLTCCVYQTSAPDMHHHSSCSHTLTKCTDFVVIKCPPIFLNVFGEQDDAR